MRMKPMLTAKSDLKNPRVLLVDDHEVGRKSLARLLTLVGFEVMDVNDGKSALEALRGPCKFDYVLTDVRLPDYDGREVVQAARRLVPTPRIALVTGWDVEPDESEQLGIEWVFLKPLNIQEMVAKLRQSPPCPRLSV
jgi:two-component system, cell cycle response regulator CpdR